MYGAIIEIWSFLDAGGRLVTGGGGVFAGQGRGRRSEIEVRRVCGVFILARRGLSGILFFQLIGF